MVYWGVYLSCCQRLRKWGSYLSSTAGGDDVDWAFWFCLFSAAVMGSTTTLPTYELTIRLPNLETWCFVLFLSCWRSAKIYGQQAISGRHHLEFYHKVALLIETAVSSEENLLLVVSWAAASGSRLLDKNTPVYKWWKKKIFFCLRM